LSSNTVVQYSVGPITTLHGPTLFLNNDAVLKDDSAPLHTAGTVQSQFEEHEGELQHLPLPSQ
jgi:hypothetical protein